MWVFSKPDSVDVLAFSGCSVEHQTSVQKSLDSASGIFSYQNRVAVELG